MIGYKGIILDYIITKDEIYGKVVAIVPRINQRADDDKTSDYFYKHSLISSSIEYTESEPSVRIKKTIIPWWGLNKPAYSFNDPKIQLRLEKLMGTSEVRFIDGNYFLTLQKKIKLLHLQEQKIRIEKRKIEEEKRVKDLILLEKLKHNELDPIMENLPDFFRKYNAKLSVRKLRSKNKQKVMRKISSSSSSSSKESNDCESSSFELLNKMDLIIPEDQHQNHYKDSRIQNLQNCKGTKELYRMADEIMKKKTLK